MATDIGANIVGDDLIFGFDSGYGVADNSTATRFYPGEPTVNYVSDSPSQGGWSGGIDVLDSSQKKFKCHISNFNGSPGAGWRSFTWNMNDHSGSDVTISLDFETVGPNGTMAWIMVGQTNTQTGNNSGAGEYMGYSAASEKTTKSTTSKERVTWTGTIGSTGTASQPSGHIGFTIWINDGVTGNQDAYVIVSNVQIEKKDHATPFVNGTRSSTAGLIDLKRTVNISLSNMSFYSTGLPAFDGTDDRITFSAGSFPTIGTNNFTVEVIAKNTKTSSYNHFFAVGNQYHFSLKMQNATNTDRNIYVYRSSSTSTFSAITANAPSTSKFYHIVLKREGDNLEIFLDGVSGGTKSGWNNISIDNDTNASYVGWGNGTEYTGGDIPVLKLYSKALSDVEIKQNYNAYKKRFDL